VALIDKNSPDIPHWVSEGSGFVFGCWEPPLSNHWKWKTAQLSGRKLVLCEMFIRDNYGLFLECFLWWVKKQSAPAE